MADDKLTEKQFIEYLDRLLAGEDISAFVGLSDDLKNDLLFTRMMLEGRDEPDPGFKAQLKQRLLNKLSAETASRQAPLSIGFWERFRAISQQKLILGFVSGAAALMLLMVGVYVTNNLILTNVNKQTAAPLPANVLPSGNYAVNLPQRIVPDNLTYTIQASLSSNREQVPVYQIATPAVTAATITELGKRLGLQGQIAATDDGARLVITDGIGSQQKQLVMWKATGAIEYGFTDTTKLYTRSTATLPAINEAKKIAYDFLSKADLIPPGLDKYGNVEKNITVIAGGSYSAGAQAAAKTGQADAANWLVTLPYYIDGRLATGPGSKIEVTIGGGGEVVKMLWTWRSVNPVFTGNTKSTEQAYKEFIGGSGSMDIPQNSSKLVIKQVKLGYWLDNYTVKQDYVLPVYEFTGECLDKNGKLLEEFSGWLPALN